MPPVRWRKQSTFIVINTFLLLQLILPFQCADGQQMQDAISMTSDGWRPIVGTGRQPQFNSEEKEITYYRNPIKNSESVIKAEVVTTVKPQSTSTGTPKVENGLKPNFKKPLGVNNGHKVKFNHGPHIPLHGLKGSHFPNGPGGRLVHGPPLKKIPPTSNNNIKHLNGKRINGKPIVGFQNTAYSHREEVFVPAPSTVAGTYTFINQGPKIRETPGLGLFGSPFLTPPASHLDFTNRFSLPPTDNVYHTFNPNPIQNFVFGKSPQINDIHNYQFQSQNDEYTRNLVPPPSPFKSFDDGKDKKKKLNVKIKEATVTEVAEDIRNNQQQQTFKSPPENIILQVPPPFEQNFAFKSNNNNKKVEVQVTKEKLKVFHNQIPPNYNPNVDFADYDFHTIRNQPLPKVQTYEVTEGKWIEQGRPQSSFSFQQQPQKLNKIHKNPIRQPQVDLNIQPFLPTPFRPENQPIVAPTAPTQADVAHIFTTVTNNMNKYREEILTNNPLFFDVKEVSTHYPILGRPELVLPSNLRDNEITTNNNNNNNNIKWPSSAQTDLNEITTEKPVRQPGRRRRPGSRRTTTSTTSTTTEEPQQITESNINEAQVEETERPHRRRPIRYKTTSTTTTSEPLIEQNYSVEKINRNRQRIRNQQRKRVRPTTTELPPNHKITPSDAELIDYITTEGQYLKETTQTVPEQNFKYEQGAEESIIKDFETGIIKLKPSTSGSLEEYFTTTEEITRNRYPSTVETTSIRIPENEVDFTTQKPAETDEDNQTIATTEATSTTTETTTIVSSTKRNRGRPMKYDTSSRPRFSVKDYRSRLNQYSSSTTSATTTTERSIENNRLRYQSRLRTRPTTTPRTTSLDSETEKPSSTRGRFKSSKYNSNGMTTEASDAIITDKSIKSVNTRLRPFGRYRSSTTESPATTTSASSTPRVSIRPNLFAQRRRPPQLSLRDRINKFKSNKTEVEENETEATIHNETAVVPTTDKNDDEVNTVDENDSSVSLTDKMSESSEEDDEDKQIENTTNAENVDILKNDASIYSQRVSDLTSSSQNEYNTPGVFKSVSPNSRRVPSHFTISTEDPILPIETFFPNIKDKE